MIKLLKNKSGFTLVEIMMAAGIASLVGLIAYSTLKTSTDVGTKISIGSETAYLKNLIISTMSNPIACENTFLNQPLTLVDTVEIKDKYGKVILKKDTEIGIAKKNLLKISKIQSIAATNSDNLLVLTVDYDLNANTSKSVTTKLKNSFNVNIFIKKNPAGNAVASCMVDTTLLLNEAIKASCQDGEGAAHYVAPADVPAIEASIYPNGKCVHDITFTNPDLTKTTLNTSIPANTLKKCEDGYYLAAVTTPGIADAVNSGITNFECKKISTAPECAPGSYLKTIVATGVATCETIAATIPTGLNAGDIIVPTASGYVGKNINCPTDKVLKRLDSSGNPDCVPKIINRTCPNPGEFISEVDANGDVKCKAVPSGTSCGTNEYVSELFSTGAVTCAKAIIPGSCPAGQAIYSVDVNGTISCR